MTVRCIFNPTRFTGVSTDVKPDRSDEQGVNEGATFFETDTRLTYLFTAGQWHEAARPSFDDHPLFHALLLERLDHMIALLETLND